MTANPFRFLADFVGASVVLAREVHGLVAQQLAPVDPCVARPGTYGAALLEAEEADEVTDPWRAIPHLNPGDLVSVQMPDGTLRTDRYDGGDQLRSVDRLLAGMEKLSSVVETILSDVPAGDDATPQAPPAGQDPFSDIFTRGAARLSYWGDQNLARELHAAADFMRRIESE